MAEMEREPAERVDLAAEATQAVLEAGHLGGVHRTFSDGWRVYETMVVNDYLGHREIYAAARGWLLEFADRPVGVLELGCGDASQSARLFAGLPLTGYTGVDLSEPALAAAPANLAALGCPYELHAGELLAYLCASGELADLVFVSFAVHHLLEDGKRAFLHEAARHLAAGGAVLYVDVFRRDGESRTEYLARYRAMVESRWTALDPDERAFILDHIETSDYPSSERELRAWAAEAGFATVTPLYRGVCDTERAFGLRAV